MEATRIDIAAARPLGFVQQHMGIETPSEAPIMALASTWSAIHEAAATVGELAGIDAAVLNDRVAHGQQAHLNFAGGAVRMAVADLAGVMRSGVSALLAAHVSGGVPQPAALALWSEFLIARDAVLLRVTRSTIDQRL